MAIQGVDTKCYILALFIRDDGERFLLGSGYYEFKDEQMHFSANTIENDTISVQGNDGYLLAGQVRRPGSQEFNGFVGDGTVDKSMVEQKRRDFFSFFRKNFFYKVVYVFPNGTAIQRKRGFLVDDPTVQELYQIYPQYHVALNFEDVNYYSYAEDDDGQEIYAKVAEIQLTASAATGGLIWDASGVVWEDVDYTWSSAPGGTSFVILNQLDMRAKIKDLVIQGDTSQQTYSGKNLYNATMSETTTSSVTYSADNSKMVINGKATSDSGCNFNTMSLKAGTYKFMVELVSGTIASTSTGGLFLFSGTNITTSPSNIALTNTNPKGSITVTVSSDTTNARIQIWARTTDTYTNAVVKYQLVSGSAEDWNFEPFVGGTASPNPDYPQDIDVVTGEQTVWLHGKNLFDKNTADQGKYVNAYGNIANDATALLSDYILIRPNTDYYLSNRTTWNSIALYDSNKTYLERLSFNYTSGVVNISNPSCAYIRINAALANLNDMQLEKGSAATTYEPYQGASYDVHLGNMFDVSTTVAGDIKGNNSTIRLCSTQALWLDAGTYTFSSNVQSPLQYILGINQVGAPPLSDYPTYSYNSGWTSAAQTTFTLTQAGWLSVQFRKNGNTTLTVDDIKPYSFYLNRGSSIVAPIELCKIGNYQDYIYKSGDDWYVYKEIGKVVLNGSENWATIAGQNTGNTFYSATKAIDSTVGTSANLYSDNFTQINNLWGGDDQGSQIFPALPQDKLRFRILKSSLGTADITGWQTWLSTHNTTVYYALATPTDTKITNADLIADLNALGSFRLLVGENNVITTATGTNLPAPVQFKYVSAYATTGAEWEEGGPSGPTTVSVDSIAQVFPVWEVRGPAVNPQLSILTTGTTVTYNGTVTASQVLSIDMFNKTATLNGTSVVGNVSGDWVCFDPGTNRVVYTTGNADALPSTIKWQEIVG